VAKFYICRRVRREHIELGGPQVVARDDPRVVGWCDIVPWWHHTLRQCGALGMGSLTGYRGRGLGNVFFGAGLERAVQARVTGWNSRPEKTTCVRSLCKDLNAANGSC
jgi:hypothetical protein